MESFDRDKYERARKKVDAIKGFHSHLKAFIIINLFILLIRANFLSLFRIDSFDPQFERWLDWNVWGTFVIWGIALLLHGIYVYRFNFGFIKRWEERKIREYLNQQNKDINDLL